MEVQEMELLCPLCGETLERADRSYVCQNRHSFDIARQGYVNLLTVQQKGWRGLADARATVAA